jgi:hypothetical protein
MDCEQIIYFSYNLDYLAMQSSSQFLTTELFVERFQTLL